MLTQTTSQRQTVGVNSLTLVASDSIENGSTRIKLKATGHAAQIGDIVRLTSKGHVGVEARVVSVDTDYIQLNNYLPLTAGVGDTFEILRVGYNVGGAALITLTHSRVSCPNNSSQIVLAAGVIAKPGGWIQNNTTQTFWLEIGGTAVLNQGIQLYGSGQIFVIPTAQQIQAIQNSGGALSLDVYAAS